MTMHADRYVDIGSTHAVCQDYALVSQHQGRVAVYVSDGCSDSPDSDFGARFLCTAATRFFDHTPGWEMAALGAAQWMAGAFNLPERCLHATLMAASEYAGGTRVHVYGDGVVAARRRDGTIEHAVIECPLGAPDYLLYQLRKQRFLEYQAAIAHHVGQERTDGLKHIVIRVNGEHHSSKKSALFEPVEFIFPREDYDLVALMTDGARSFQRREGAKLVPVPDSEVVQQVMSVGNFKGDFAVRRVRNGFLQRHCIKNGWTHYDDFGVGMIYQGDPLEPVTEEPVDEVEAP